MVKKNKLRIVQTSQSADSKARRLEEQWQAGELTDEKFFEELDALRTQGPLGPEASYLFIDSYLTYRGTDRWILEYLERALRMYPDVPMFNCTKASIAMENELSILAIEALESASDFIPTDDPDYMIFEQNIEETLEAIEGVDSEEDFPYLLRLDEARWELFLNRIAEGELLLNRLRLERPTWLPLLLAQAEYAWDTCKFDQAEAFYRELLSLYPESSSGRLGLCRLLLLLGRDKEATPYLDGILKENTLEQNLTQTLEVLLISRRVKDCSATMVIKLKELLFSEGASPYTENLAGAFFHILGEDPLAKKIWNKTFDTSGYDLCKWNIKDLKVTPAKQYGPRVFMLQNLVPLSCSGAIEDKCPSSEWEEEKAVDRFLGSLRINIPGMLKGLGTVLAQWGDEYSIYVFFRQVIVSWFPELVEYFTKALDTWNVPEGRARKLVETIRVPDPKKAPSDLQWNITWDTEPLSLQLYELNQKAFAALNREDWELAERLYGKLKEMTLDHPAFWYNLRFVVGKLGKKEEEERLEAEIRTHFPSYLLLQIEDAKIIHSEGEKDRAHAILDTMLDRQFLHGNELRAIIQAKMDFLIVEKNYKEAYSWFQLWQKFEIDPAMLEPYKILRLYSIHKKRMNRNSKAQK